jgi:hypothetical protein
LALALADECQDRNDFTPVVLDAMVHDSDALRPRVDFQAGRSGSARMDAPITAVIGDPSLIEGIPNNLRWTTHPALWSQQQRRASSVTVAVAVDDT